MVCQVKLSNGLMVHGPQCQSEHDAKEKAAFFALQRLVCTHKRRYLIHKCERLNFVTNEINIKCVTDPL